MIFVCETLCKPLKCSEMMPLEIWNWIISTFWWTTGMTTTTSHNAITGTGWCSTCSGAPPLVVPDFSGPVGDTVVLHWKLSPWATWTGSLNRCHRRRCRRTRATSHSAYSPAGRGCGTLQVCILGWDSREAPVRVLTVTVTMLRRPASSTPPVDSDCFSSKTPGAN